MAIKLRQLYLDKNRLRDHFIDNMSHLAHDKSGIFSLQHQVNILNITNEILNNCLQCFDAVGWAAGRASGL